MRDSTLQADDETNITELNFLPDGRICVFGMSREVLELLSDLALGDPALARRRERLRESTRESPPQGVELASPSGHTCASGGGEIR